MRRLLTLVVNNPYRRPRVMNITNLIKKQTNANIDNTHAQNKSAKTFPTNQNAEQKGEDTISWRDINNAINRSQQTYTREELEINHHIKIQTKTSSLFELYKSKYSSLTAKNVVNLLIKMLQLRHINSKQEEQLDKLDKIVALAHKKLHKMTPEDMIRFLYSLKNVEINHTDLKRINSFIMAILVEFGGRSIIKGVDTFKSYQSFQVMSVQSTLKLIFSLRHLHEISGREYEPQIVTLIRQTLNYFHSFVKNNLNKPQGHKEKIIKWHFYTSLIDLLIKYEMPPQTIVDFIKILLNQKKSLLGSHSHLVSLEISITNIHNIQQIRGDKITQYRQIFTIYQLMYQAIEKPEELIKIKPYLIIKHLEALNWFTEKQLSLLGFEKIKHITYMKVLNFTLKTLHKYLTRDYTTQLQKSTIQEWVTEGVHNYKEYLGQFLLFFHNLTMQSNSTYTADFNKILNLCLQFYSELSFNTQAVILQISFLRKFKNTKHIIDLFFDRESTKTKNGRKIKYFKKHQEIQSYLQLFTYWKQIRQLSKFSFDQYRQGVFIKGFFRSIVHLPQLQSYPNLLANKIEQQSQFLNLLIKKYKKYSIENRSLSKVYIDKVQEYQFKKQLESITQVLKNQNEDTFILSSYSQVKHCIREKTKRSLQIYKLFITLLENLRQRKIITESNITKYELFQQITAEFQQEVQCLSFKQLYTLQIYDLAHEITVYLKEKSDRDFKVYNIQKHRENLGLSLDNTQKKGLYIYLNKQTKQTPKQDNV